MMASHLAVVVEQEDDGRWIAEIEALPGVLAYGSTPAEARAKVEALALQVLADRREHGAPFSGVGGPVSAQMAFSQVAR